MPLDPIALKTLALELSAALPPPRPAPTPSDVSFIPIDTSPRAVMTRGILRIANRFHWNDAVVHFLETKGVSYLSDLSEPQLEDLLQRMEGYVDAAETGCSLVDCLPAS